MGKHWQFPERLGYEKRAEERRILFLPLVRTSTFSCPETSELMIRVTSNFRIHPSSLLLQASDLDWAAQLAFHDL